MMAPEPHAGRVKIYERLPERKQMTIALGLLASDGAVIAADTEESTGDYMKGVRGKMACYFAHDDEWAESCVVTGAGNSGYVRALMEELGQTYQAADPKTAIFSHRQSDAKDTLQYKFRECIKKFYKEHIIPFATYP